jgi:hypothetical protein
MRPRGSEKAAATGLIVRCNILLHCTKPPLYVPISTAVAFRVGVAATDRCQRADRLWAQIRAMPDHRPKGQVHD